MRLFGFEHPWLYCTAPPNPVPLFAPTLPAAASLPPTPGSTTGQPTTSIKATGAERRAKGKGKGKQQAAAAADAEAGGVVAEGGGAAAAAAAGDPSSVEALLKEAGFINRLGDYCYGIPQGEEAHL